MILVVEGIKGFSDRQKQPVEAKLSDVSDVAP